LAFLHQRFVVWGGEATKRNPSVGSWTYQSATCQLDALHELLDDAAEGTLMRTSSASFSTIIMSFSAHGGGQIGDVVF